MEDVPAWFRERDNAGRDRAWIIEPWEALIGGTIPVWDVAGHHFQPFSSVHVSRSLVSRECVVLMRVCRWRRRRYSLIVRVGTWRRSRSSLSHSFLFLFFFCWIDPLSRHSLQIFRCVFSFLSFVSLRNGIFLHCALHSWHRPLYHMTRPLQGFHGSLQY